MSNSIIYAGIITIFTTVGTLTATCQVTPDPATQARATTETNKMDSSLHLTSQQKDMVYKTNYKYDLTSKQMTADQLYTLKAHTFQKILTPAQFIQYQKNH